MVCTGQASFSPCALHLPGSLPVFTHNLHVTLIWTPPCPPARQPLDSWQAALQTYQTWIPPGSECGRLKAARTVGQGLAGVQPRCFLRDCLSMSALRAKYLHYFDHKADGCFLFYMQWNRQSGCGLSKQSSLAWCLTVTSVCRAKGRVGPSACESYHTVFQFSIKPSKKEWSAFPVALISHMRRDVTQALPRAGSDDEAPLLVFTSDRPVCSWMVVKREMKRRKTNRRLLLCLRGMTSAEGADSGSASSVNDNMLHTLARKNTQTLVRLSSQVHLICLNYCHRGGQKPEQRAVSVSLKATDQEWVSVKWNWPGCWRHTNISHLQKK